ncbi:MAG: NYN domain-containing protein [Ferruginibacter sp.]|nr:NYN domain-containing protein [Ferruginibacter sp.]
MSMMLDCFNNNADTLVLISADSDQVPTIQAIKKNFPEKKVKVYFPPNRKSAELLAVLRHVVYLENNEDKFRSSVMSEKIQVGGKIYTRPFEWKH